MNTSLHIAPLYWADMRIFFSAPAKPRKDPLAVFLAQTRDNIYSVFILPWQRNVELACEDTGHPPRQA